MKENGFVKRWVAVAVAVVAIAACSSSNKSSKGATTTTTPSPPTSANANQWAPAQIAQAQQLAAKLRAHGIACDGYKVDDKSAWVRSNPTLPPPGAIAECTSAGENLTIETFDSEGHAYGYMGTKINLICTSKSGVHPNFPYVAALTWFIEPDTKATGDRIAAAEGGLPSVVSRESACPK
jgi:hypothetical protein